MFATLILTLYACKKQDTSTITTNTSYSNQTSKKEPNETYYTHSFFIDKSGSVINLTSEQLNNENAVFVGVATNDSTLTITYFPDVSSAISHCNGNNDLQYVADKLNQISTVRNFAQSQGVNFESDEEPSELVRNYMDSVFGSQKTTSVGLMWEHITTTVNNQNQTVYTGGGSTMVLTQAAQYSFFSFRNKASLVWQVGWNTLCDHRWWGGQKYFCFGAGYVPLGGTASAGPNFFNDRAESGF